MPRPATGSIVERRGGDGRIYRSLRFRALGRRRTTPLEPVSRAEAERELAFVMADVARGQWRPPDPIEPHAEPEIPTFHVFAEQWWLLRERTWRPKTIRDYRWKLEAHLIPFFGELRLDRITVAEVERTSRRSSSSSHDHCRPGRSTHPSRCSRRFWTRPWTGT
jgi:hypothetical protein